MVCFLTDLLQLTYELQRFLQVSRLNFVEIAALVKQLIKKLKVERGDSNFTQVFYYGLITFDVASKSRVAKTKCGLINHSKMRTLSKKQFSLPCHT